MVGGSMSGNEIVTAILIFIGVMAITSLVFGSWVVLSILRGIGNLLSGSTRNSQRAVSQQRPPVVPVAMASSPRAYVPPVPPTPPPIQPQPHSLGALLNVKNAGVPGDGIPCQGQGCRQVNPLSARFCRRCGHPISQVTAAAQRRVAMW